MEIGSSAQASWKRQMARYLAAAGHDIAKCSTNHGFRAIYR
jgi:hypothetical protein